MNFFRINFWRILSWFFRGFFRTFFDVHFDEKRWCHFDISKFHFSRILSRSGRFRSVCFWWKWETQKMSKNHTIKSMFFLIKKFSKFKSIDFFVRTVHLSPPRMWVPALLRQHWKWPRKKSKPWTFRIYIRNRELFEFSLKKVSKSWTFLIF